MLNATPISGIEQPRQSLAAATAISQGTALPMSRVRSTLSMFVLPTGSPAILQVALMGSSDGVNFVLLALYDVTVNNAAGDFVVGSAHAVTWARADVLSISGGTNPTVTATISAI